MLRHRPARRRRKGESMAPNCRGEFDRPSAKGIGAVSIHIVHRASIGHMQIFGPWHSGRRPFVSSLNTLICRFHLLVGPIAFLPSQMSGRKDFSRLRPRKTVWSISRQSCFDQGQAGRPPWSRSMMTLSGQWLGVVGGRWWLMGACLLAL